MLHSVNGEDGDGDAKGQLTVPFTKAHGSAELRDNPELYTLLHRLRTLQCAIVSEDNSTSLSDEVVYVVLLCRWVHYIREYCVEHKTPHVSSSVQLMFPMPGNQQTNCVLAEIYYRLYRAVLRLLRYAADHDVWCPVAGSYSEEAVDYETRMANNRVMRAMLGCISYADRVPWGDREATLTAVHLPLGYMEQVRIALKSYIFWNMACAKAQKILSLSRNRADLYDAHGNDTRNVPERMALVRGLDTTARAQTVLEDAARHTPDMDGHIHIYADDGDLGGLDSGADVISGSKGSGALQVYRHPVKLQITTKAVAVATKGVNGYEDECVHPSETPTGAPSYTARYDDTQQIVHLMYTSRQFMTQLPCGGINLCGTDKKTPLQLRGVSKTDASCILLNGAVSLDYSTAPLSDAELKSLGKNTRYMQWSEQVGTAFVTWAGRVRSVRNDQPLSIACKRTVQRNGVLSPGLKFMENAGQADVLAYPVPGSTFHHLVQSVTSVAELLRERGFIKSPVEL